jgi:hypothetical protein
LFQIIENSIRERAMPFSVRRAVTFPPTNCGDFFTQTELPTRLDDRRVAQPVPNHRQHRRGRDGEVFRARDTRLNRDVAVKVLPKDFGAVADRLRRFEQEAKTLAALNRLKVP